VFHSVVIGLNVTIYENLIIVVWPRKKDNFANSIAATVVVQVSHHPDWIVG
jgi:predicted Zn-dependent protease with MMP-like domain